MGLYPVIIKLDDRPVTVIGGGGVALRKIEDLLEAGAVVRSVSPAFREEIETLAKDNPGRLELLRRPYRDGDLAGAALVFSATNDPKVNRQVYQEAERRGIFINAVDDPPNCSFIVPSVTRRGDFLLAVSTGGASPAMAARLRRLIEQAVPENTAEVLDALKEARRVLLENDKFRDMDSSSRGELLKKIVNDDGLLRELVDARGRGEMASWLAKKKDP